MNFDYEDFEEFEEDYGYESSYRFEDYSDDYDEDNFGDDDEFDDDDFGDDDDDFGEIVEDDINEHEIVIDSSDYGRISFGGGQYSSGDIRDPVNIAIRKLIRIIRNNYSECLRIDEDSLRFIGEFLFSFEPNQILTMNMDVFAPAILYLNKYKSIISKENLRSFIKDCKGLQYIGSDNEMGDGYLDLLRYIRMLEKPLRKYKFY